MNLYIIGNGFDIRHNLPSSYRDFCHYMQDTFPTEYERIGKLYFQNPSELWSDFERNLSKLDIARFVERNIDHWITEKTYQIGNEFDDVYSFLKTYFHTWVIDRLSKVKTTPMLPLTSNDIYINFNYTNILTSCYGIPKSRILYIHGDTADNEVFQPIVGHGESDEDVLKKIRKAQTEIGAIVSRALHNKSSNYTAESLSYIISDEINKYLSSLRKDTESIICSNQHFFDALAQNQESIKNAIILGHSMDEIDMPYFRKISDTLRPDVQWFRDYRKGDVTNKDKKLTDFKNKMGFDALAYENWY